MAYATKADVQAILPEGETIPDDAVMRVNTVLDEATDLVIGYLGFEYGGDAEPDVPDADSDGVPDDVPGAVRRVTARIALRAFEDLPDSPGAATNTATMGPFAYTINWSKEAQDRSVYMTDGEKLRIERFRRSYVSGAAHVPMYTAAEDICAW